MSEIPSSTYHDPSSRSDITCLPLKSAHSDNHTTSTSECTNKPHYPDLSELPPLRNDNVSAETLTRVGQYLEAKSQYNFDLTQSIQSKKDFGNPQILTKVVEYFHIDEIGSNYPPSLFDPHAIQARNKTPATATATALAPNADPRNETIPRNSIQFVSATVSSSSAHIPTSSGRVPGIERRKSKWGDRL